MLQCLMQTLRSRERTASSRDIRSRSERFKKMLRRTKKNIFCFSFISTARRIVLLWLLIESLCFRVSLSYKYFFSVVPLTCDLEAARRKEHFCFSLSRQTLKKTKHEIYSRVTRFNCWICWLQPKSALNVLRAREKTQQVIGGRALSLKAIWDSIMCRSAALKINRIKTN